MSLRRRLRSWLPTASRTPARRPTARLGMDTLEDRTVPAVVSWWTADNTALDAVGTNHGTLVSGTAYAPGQINQAFSFDGVDDRVQVADSESLKLTSSMTIEGWVRADSITPSGGVILFRGDDRGGLDPYSLSTTSTGALQFQVSSLNQGRSLSTLMPLGQFVHVAGTLDDATGAMRLYLNGVLMSQTTTTVRPFGDLDPDSNPGIGIGNHGGYPTTPHNFPFHGLIDELKVYDHALTAEDVLANFNAGRGSLSPTISINDSTIIEGDTSIRYLGNLVSAREGGLDDPYALIYGPDGALYVSNRFGNGVLRYDASTGAPLPAAGKPGAEFVSPGAGGLSQARGIAFGPDGNLYVGSTDTDAVLRYSAATGDFLDAFVPAGAGGLDAPRGLLFHTDGYLYVTSVGGTTAAPGVDAILRFNATTGAPAGLSGTPGDAVFIASGTGGMDNPSVIISHGGDFYVSSTSPSTSNSVLRFAANGTFLGAFVPSGSGGLSGPVDLVFRDGYLYVTSWTNNKILRYDGATGNFVNEIASAAGLARPMGLLFEPSGNLLVASGDSDEIRRYGQSLDMVFTVTLGAPFPTSVSVDYQTADGTALAGSDYQQASGTLTFAPGTWSKTIVVPTLDDTVVEPTETFTVTLSNPVGATISEGLAVGTIFDNDLPPTRFYVVNDAATDRTYEYGASGTAVENYGLATGNTAPRGAASTAAGDKVWVVDANRKVYVYDAGGALLGTWTAGSLATNSTPEGIATNGTDVWIVDSKSDKVFRYSNAAGRLSGSQNAASSFSLNKSNKDSTGIVTDGSSLWVVNNSSTDQVFKYSLTGALQGSWTLTGGGESPTGVTLDPSAPSHLWVVDNATDRVYQYDAAVGRTSGSQAASASFALAAGNTNPQDIADPPVPGSGVISIQSTAVLSLAGDFLTPEQPVDPAPLPPQADGRSTRTAVPTEPELLLPKASRLVDASTEVEPAVPAESPFDLPIFEGVFVG